MCFVVVVVGGRSGQAGLEGLRGRGVDLGGGCGFFFVAPGASLGDTGSQGLEAKPEGAQWAPRRGFAPEAPACPHAEPLCPPQTLWEHRPVPRWCLGGHGNRLARALLVRLTRRQACRPRWGAGDTLPQGSTWLVPRAAGLEPGPAGIRGPLQGPEAWGQAHLVGFWWAVAVRVARGWFL